MNFIKPVRKDTIFLGNGIWRFTDQFLLWANTSLEGDYEIETTHEFARPHNLLFAWEHDAVAYDLTWTETWPDNILDLLSIIE